MFVSLVFFFFFFFEYCDGLGDFYIFNVLINRNYFRNAYVVQNCPKRKSQRTSVVAHNHTSVAINRKKHSMRFKISYFILEIYSANEVQSKEYVTSFLCVVRCCFDR